MKTFYCVSTEFYDNGTVKACMASGNYKAMPKSQFKETPIADCYKDWFETEAEAKKFLAEAKSA
jgi:hypothetical protein